MVNSAISLFEEAIRSLPLRRILLAGAQNSTPTRRRGVHLRDPLFSQWALVDADGWVLRIHCFHRDDPDVPHNHAWEWRSLILAGEGYLDISADGSAAARRPGDVVTDDGARFHRVQLIGGPTWTLFLHGPDQREWGFLGEGATVIPRDSFVSVNA